MLTNHPSVLGNGVGAVTATGAGIVGGPTASTDNALVRWDGTTGVAIQNGIVTEADDTGTLTGPVYSATVTAVGSAFTNQPANDGIEVLSSNAGDITQTVTIIGTTNASNTVVVETVTLNGTTPVATTKVDWGLVLAVKKSATTLGTVTVREASADATITAGLTAAVLSVGVNLVSAANQLAYARQLSAVSDGATTKQIGFQGTNTSDAVIYDSKPLNGTTAVLSNSSFRTVTEIYTGDVEAARTETVTTSGGWTLTGGDVSIVATGATGTVTLTAGASGSISTASPFVFPGSANKQRFFNNFSTATQTPGATTRTYVTGSNIAFTAGQIIVGTTFRWRLNMTKTAAGTAATTFDIAFGTAGTTADTARVSFSKPGGTTAADEGWVTIEAIVNTNSASGVVIGEFTMIHNLAATGHALIPCVVVSTTSGTFNTTTVTNVGLCITTGASDAITILQVSTQAINI